MLQSSVWIDSVQESTGNIVLIGIGLEEGIYLSICCRLAVGYSSGAMCDLTVNWHAGSVCCVAWKNDHYFATASADHVIYIHHGDQPPSSPLKGSDPDLTHLTWSPDGELESVLLLCIAFKVHLCQRF